jgi:hypothetical protein
MKLNIVTKIVLCCIISIAPCLAQDLQLLSKPTKKWQLGVETLWLANKTESMPTIMFLKRQVAKPLLTQTRYILGFNYLKNNSSAIIFFPNTSQFATTTFKKLDFLLRVGKQKEILALGKEISILAGVDIEYRYRLSEGLNDGGRDTLNRIPGQKKPIFDYTITNVNRIGVLGVVTASYSPSPLVSIILDNDFGVYYENADNFRGTLAAGKYLNLGLWPMSRLYIIFRF